MTVAEHLGRPPPPLPAEGSAGPAPGCHRRQRRRQLQPVLADRNGGDSLFDREDDATPSRKVRLDPAMNRTYHYWHVFVPRVVARTGLRLSRPRAVGPRSRHRVRTLEKILLDPYARGLVVPAGYDREAAKRPGDNAATAMKNVVVDSSAYDSPIPTRSSSDPWCRTSRTSDLRRGHSARCAYNNTAPGNSAAARPRPGGGNRRSRERHSGRSRRSCNSAACNRCTLVPRRWWDRSRTRTRRPRHRRCLQPPRRARGWDRHQRPLRRRPSQSPPSRHHPPRRSRCCRRSVKQMTVACWVIVRGPRDARQEDHLRLGGVGPRTLVDGRSGVGSSERTGAGGPGVRDGRRRTDISGPGADGHPRTALWIGRSDVESQAGTAHGNLGFRGVRNRTSAGDHAGADEGDDEGRKERFRRRTRPWHISSLAAGRRSRHQRGQAGCWESVRFPQKFERHPARLPRAAHREIGVG